MRLHFLERSLFSKVYGNINPLTNRKRRLFFPIALVLLVTSNLLSQPVKQWDKSFGVTREVQFGSIHRPAVRRTADGNFIAAMNAYGPRGEDKTERGVYNDPWIVKFKPDGTKIWENTLVEASDAYQVDIQPTRDSGYIVCSASSADQGWDKSENSHGSDDFWIVKLDSNGIIEWDKTIGGSGSDSPIAIVQATDGGYLVAGWSYSGVSFDKTSENKGESDYWVVKLTAEGEKVWDASFGGTGEDYLFNIQNTQDGGYIIGGYSAFPAGVDNRQTDLLVVKIDSLGNKKWEKTIGDSDSQILDFIHPHTDGGFFLVGSSFTFTDDDVAGSRKRNWEGLLVKIDSLGNTEWDKMFGGAKWDYFNYMEPTLDGGYLISAMSSSEAGRDKTENSKEENDPNNVLDFWLIKLSASFEKVWDKTIGGDGDDALAFATETSPGNYLMAGQSSSGLHQFPGDRTAYRKGFYDLWIVNAFEEKPPLPVTLTSFTAQRERQTAVLTWQTTSETRSDCFEVQHSINGKLWNSLATLNAKGESSALQSYQYVHTSPAAGENLYRLKMVDTNGTFTYSKIESLHYDSDIAVNIFPNPAGEILTIASSDWKSVKAVQLLNSNSVEVYRSESIANKIIDVKRLPSGLYFVKLIRQDGTSVIQKVIVAR